MPPAVQPPRVADGWRPRAATGTSWLIVACYLAAALALTWRLWADPAARAQTGDMHDVDLFAWFMRYAATAVTHGKLPALVTTAMNAPRGINVMWNTSVLLPAVLLTPVTVLAGPQVSLTVLLTLGFAGSAASLYWVLRQWSASPGAAALGGAVYGFSPALVAAGAGHYHLQFAVLPPVLIHLLLRLVTGRGRPLRTGAGLGLLAAAQLLISEELLAMTALAGAVVVVTLAVCGPGAARERLAGERLAGATAGLAAAAAVFLVAWLPAIVAVAAVLPLIPLPLPVTTAAPVPAGWEAAFRQLRLAPGVPVLVVPVPYEEAPQALRWQADTGQPGSLIGGWFIGPDVTGHAALYGGGQVKRAGKHLNALLAADSRVPAATAAQVRADLATWRPAAVVAVTQPSSRLARVLTGLLGPPAVRSGQVLAWRR